MDTKTKTSAAVGEIAVDLQVVRRAAFAPRGDAALRPPEYHEQLKKSEARLAAMDGLALALALFEYTRMTGVRLKI